MLVLIYFNYLLQSYKKKTIRVAKVVDTLRGERKLLLIIARNKKLHYATDKLIEHLVCAVTLITVYAPTP